MSAYDVMDGLLRTSLVESIESTDPLSDLAIETHLIAEGNEGLLGLWYMATGRSLVFCEDEQFEQWLDEADDDEGHPAWRGKGGRVKPEFVGAGARTPKSEPARQQVPARKFDLTTYGSLRSPEEKEAAAAKSKALGIAPEGKPPKAGKEYDPHPDLPKFSPTRVADVPYEVQTSKAGEAPSGTGIAHRGQLKTVRTVKTGKGDEKREVPRKEIQFPKLGKEGAQALAKSRVRADRPVKKAAPFTKAVGKSAGPELMGARASNDEIHQAMHHIAGIANPHALKKHEREAIGKVMDAHADRAGYAGHAGPEGRDKESASKAAWMKRQEAIIRGKAANRAEKDPTFDHDAYVKKEMGDANELWHSRQPIAAPKLNKGEELDRSERGLAYLTGTSQSPKATTYKEPFYGIRQVAAQYVKKHPEEGTAPEDAHDTVRSFIGAHVKRVFGKYDSDMAKRAKKGSADPTIAKKASELGGGGDGGDDGMDMGAAATEHGGLDPAAKGSVHPSDRHTHIQLGHEFWGAHHPEHIAPVLQYRWDMHDAEEQYAKHKAAHGPLAKKSAETKALLKAAKLKHQAAQDSHDQISKSPHASRIVKNSAREKLEAAAAEHEDALHKHRANHKHLRANAQWMRHEDERHAHAEKMHTYFHNRAMTKAGMPHGTGAPYDEEDYKNYGFGMTLAAHGHGPKADEDVEESISLFDALFEANAPNPGAPKEKKKKRAAAVDKAPTGELFPAQTGDQVLKRAKDLGIKQAQTPSHLAIPHGTGAIERSVIQAAADKWFGELNPTAKSRRIAKLLGPAIAPAIQTLTKGTGTVFTGAVTGRKAKTGTEVRAGNVPTWSSRHDEPGPTIPPSQAAAFVHAAQAGIRPGVTGGALGPRKALGDAARAASVTTDRRIAGTSSGSPAPELTPERRAAFRSGRAKVLKAAKKEKNQERKGRKVLEKGLARGADPGEVQADSLSLFGALFTESRRGASLFEAILA